jgi:3-isopropylmalate dehydrogenase
VFQEVQIEMRTSRTYTVACLAGDGVGPELMAEACRALAEVSRMHGFRVDDVHVTFGSEALSRSGHPLPASTRDAYLAADAVLVAVDEEPVRRQVEAELDLRAAVSRVRFGQRGDVRVVYALSADSSEWTVDRAFEVARASRARVASVDEDAGFRELVDRAAARHDGVAVEHYTPAAGLPALAFDPERFDVVVTGSVFGDAVAEVASLLDREPHVVATGKLAANGPGLFSPGHDKSHEIAGHGVADPSSMLLAVAVMLGEGLGEHGAAETLAAAVCDACGDGLPPLRRLVQGVAATTRQFTDSVLATLPSTHANAEFLRESRA